MDRDKVFFRSPLLFSFACNEKTAAEVHRLLLDTYGDQVSSRRSGFNWFQRFKNVDFDLKDEEQPGQPKKLENLINSLL